MEIHKKMAFQNEEIHLKIGVITIEEKKMESIEMVWSRSDESD